MIKQPFATSQLRLSPALKKQFDLLQEEIKRLDDLDI
jgi:hypothetical protein